MSWTKEVWQKSLPIYERITRHPFIAELAAGTLAQEKFARYLAQDEIYIKNYGEEMFLLADMLPDVGMQEMFRAYCRLVRKHSMQGYSQPIQKTLIRIDSDLTAAQKAMVKSYSSSMIDAVTLPNSTKLGSMAGNGGYASRYPTITFEGVFCINYYFKPSKTPVGNITMYVWDQAAYNNATSLSKGNATKVINMTKSNKEMIELF